MKNIRFMVATNSPLYNPETAAQDAQEYATFANEYLRKHGFEEVEIEFVDHYPVGNSDDQASLREQIWADYRRKTS